MTDPQFFRLRTSLVVTDIVALTGAQVAGTADLKRKVNGVKPINLAGPSDITFFDNLKFLESYLATSAGVCFTRREHAGKAPPGVVILISEEPFRAYVSVVRTLFANELKPASLFGGRGLAPNASVHPEAKLEDGIVVDPGAVIGPRAEIGGGTLIGPNAVIGADVRIGRDCVIGAGTNIQHALFGDRVVVHPGAQIGQDGFGYLPEKVGHTKIPQIGRVIVQDDVEIGSGTTIDRGANRDTMIGEGTKIDNLVHIAHNVSIGRHCIIVAQVGISGSCTLGDRVMIGGQVGFVDHVSVGDGAQIAAKSGVIHDVPGGERWGGAPAKPIKEYFREITAVKRLASGKENTQTARERKK